MATTSDIRRGLTFKYNNDIYSVVDYQHVKMGRGGAFVRVKMKSLTTGKVIENSFNTSAKIEDIRVERRDYQYLYDEGDSFIFMNLETYEQIPINKNMIDAHDLLMEGDICQIVINTENDQPLTAELPPQVVRTVTYTEPGIRGDTATNTLKPATVESGAEVRVPLFINIGDKIKIDTTSKSYVERIKE
ncbi:MAG: elongation factor P [Bacteroidetes bacterium]|nr:MAG: elongation factor P [Bacteroidota bacterium]